MGVRRNEIKLRFTMLMMIVKVIVMLAVLSLRLVILVVTLQRLL